MGKKSNKNKAHPLVDKSGHDFLLKGRQSCLCEASRHALINNCLECGRIVCEQEGSGPCFTCGTYVFTKQDRDFMMSNMKEAENELENLFKTDVRLDLTDKIPDTKIKNRSLKDIAASLTDDSNLKKAIEHRDKLLEFDKKSVARSKVFDDQMDYFSMRTQNFVSDETRRNIDDKINYLSENKFKKIDKISLDFENLAVSDYSESVIKNIDEEHRKLEEMSTLKTDYEMKPAAHFLDNFLHKKNLPPPVYVPELGKKSSNNSNSNKNDSERISKMSKIFSMENYHQRVQDKEMDKIDDKGMCLAIRQPYASLLVHGIKRFEGRSWFSSFKGRLWIYAADKTPTPEEIEEIQTFYSHMGYVNFPCKYPTGAIVGCVIIEDCLPNEVYCKQYPECEIDSPYAFVCEYPIAFEKPLPLHKGGGKQIYKLDPKVHKACKGLLGF